MSEPIKRYALHRLMPIGDAEIQEHPQGAYVRVEDHAAAVARLERERDELKADGYQRARLEAELATTKAALAAAEAERDAVQRRWAECDKKLGHYTAALETAKRALPPRDNSNWNGDLVGCGVEVSWTIQELQESLATARAAAERMRQCDGVLAEVVAERARQDAKWGQQDHPSVCRVLTEREGGCSPLRMCEEYEIPGEARAKFLCQHAARQGECTFAHIAVEELSEAVSARDDAERRGELVQLAAVCVQWIERIDRAALGEKG